MGLRTQTFILSVATTLASPLVLALGLGEVKLKSALNQPLNAEIQLQQTRDLTDREILVGLASQADFDRVGVEKPPFLGDLKFKVEEGAGGLVVRITSSRPIVEPYLNFIVQAQWPSGKLLREYTLLVDLPVYSDEGVEAVQAAKAGAAVAPPSSVQSTINDAPPPSRRPTAPSARSTAPSESRPKPAPAAPAPEAPMPKTSGDTYGPVATNDTLWKIAKQSRPDNASIQQTMLAIQRLNPDAFVNGNINLLRRGQVLRLPAKDDIQESSDDAKQQVAAKTSRRNSDAAKDNAANGPQLEAAKNLSTNENKAPGVEGRVKLSSSNAADGSKSGRGAGKDTGNKEALNNELSITKEELDAKNRESGDLKSRLKTVDDKIENTEKLIAVNSEELRKLELAIEKNKANAAAPGAEPAPAEVTPATPSAPAEVDQLYQQSQPPATPPAETPTVAGPQETPPVAGPQETPPVAGPQEVPPPKPVAKAPPPPAPKASVVDMLMDNIVAVGAAAAAVLGLGLFIANRRRKAAEADSEFGLSGSGAADSSWDLDSSLPSFDEPQTDTVFKSPEAAPVVALEPEHKVKLETDDVVSESDIHISLEDFDTAEKLLLSSLEQDPGNTRVLLKLLEIYSRKGDVASFDPQFAKLHSFGDAEAIDRAEQLRSYIDDAPPFNADQFSDASFLAAVNAVTPVDPLSSFSNDLPLPKTSDESLTLTASGLEEPQTFDLEFDAVLDEGFQQDHDQTQILPAFDESLGEDDFTLDFSDVDAIGTTTTADKGSLADALANSGNADDLDLSEFDELSFGKNQPASGSEEFLSEADFELDEDALNSTTLASAELAEEDHSLDAGLSDFDLDYSHTPSSLLKDEPEDEFADLDIGELDDELDSTDDLSADDLQLDQVVDQNSLVAELERVDLDAEKFGKADALELDDESLEGLAAEDLVGTQSLADQDIDFDFEDLDNALVADDAEVDLLNDAEDDKDYAALDFDLTDDDFEADAQADDDLSESKTLVSRAITDDDLDIAAPDMDFDDLDADLGILAENFDGDLADLDDLEVAEPSLLQSSPLIMDEPVTSFGELDDLDPDEVLASTKPHREPVELENFDDSVTFPIEDPQTDLDDPLDLDDDLIADADLDDDVLDEHQLLQDVKHSSEFGTTANLDELAELDDFVEFEDLDSLEDLVGADLLESSSEPLLVDADEDRLQIPKPSDTYASHFEIPDFDPESDDDSDLGALCDGDELATKLDLLRAFVDMGDEDSAKHTLEEILEEGNAEQRQQAESLFSRLG